MWLWGRFFQLESYHEFDNTFINFTSSFFLILEVGKENKGTRKLSKRKTGTNAHAHLPYMK